ncbi:MULTISPECIES: bifunctional adenosylcobinamide kinase/adenosylcobinamide-phosphate guanylyltransferase [Dyella]|uniref:Bifunctional adenosylcobalamin biosynthesis protein n=2 Tax=Dyella TaxID=231454 RepID=A0A4R0YNI1_9GAMM|nr:MULTISPECIES: bifunctional adenosylcobinamide kinase/adenosylcobinamide-phosphate guanylyltransferase [Dyella]TBR37045.1 bifunctional adenosylcobinamide kinase/adenosylcobinamide-phosphate guanylyltransferase [Dyella terrae]TCI07866.1 bifunctional adenosylcobinamide kinase/adenosylcobinamide-phosphate guanylyltransferase [Dyella soli]
MKTLILGGARSGKSALAEQLAVNCGDDVVYVATAQPLDAAMAERIAHHRAQRPRYWHTIEEPMALAEALREHARPGRCILVDCLTLWLSNLIGSDDMARFERERDGFLACLADIPGELLLVSNEVGLGIVPLGELSRRFVDEAGRLHQRLGQTCDRVVFVAAGLPMTLKGSL